MLPNNFNHIQILTMILFALVLAGVMMNAAGAKEVTVSAEVKWIEVEQPTGQPLTVTHQRDLR